MSVIVLDAMGGDNCPQCNVDGALDAVSAEKDVTVILAGPEQELKKLVKDRGYTGDRIRYLNAPSVITPDESPVAAIRKKKDSSLVAGILEVKEGRADAFVSAGSSGAILAAGQLLLGRIRGVKRPALGSLIPVQSGETFFLDMGANVDPDPEWIRQFARMGTIYMQEVEGVASPVVKLVNLGLEEEKGDQLTKEVNRLLKEDGSLHYAGYCEAREVPYGTADVVVTDAFTGNAVIKTFEGTANLLLSVLKDTMRSGLLAKAGALLLYPALKKALKPYDISRFGGAPLLGVKGAVIKCHGNATKKEIKNALLQADAYVAGGVNESIAKAFEKV